MIDLDETQQGAVRMALQSSVSILTGGPGTGKTATLKELILAIEQTSQKSYALCAPTGKAAKRMSESCHRPASTIHRLLQPIPLGDRWGFTRGPSNPILHDFVIVDESSMLDVSLMSSLVGAIKRDTQVLFVGDANQLPSVGPGRAFADMVDSGCIPTTKLETVYRSDEGSWMCHNAPRMLCGKMIDLQEQLDFQFMDVKGLTQVPEACCDVYRRREAQILIPQKTTKGGVHAVNAAMQKRFNPHVSTRHEWKFGDLLIRQGDPVINTVNNREMGIWNGDEFTFIMHEGKPHVTRESSTGRPESFEARELSLQLSYALTIHKSQGSEWNHVAVVIHPSHHRMLTRQLIYTALTRAKLSVTIIGNEDGIRRAIHNQKEVRRNTTLKERLVE